MEHCKLYTDVEKPVNLSRTQDLMHLTTIIVLTNTRIDNNWRDNMIFALGIMKMKIGIVCYPTFGGSGVLATELGIALSDKGYEVHFITYEQPVRLNQSFHPNIYFHEVKVPTYPLFDFPPYETALASTMVNVIVNQKLDLLHLHYAIPHASAAYFARQILKKTGQDIPFITTLHGTDITLVGRGCHLCTGGYFLYQ